MAVARIVLSSTVIDGFMKDPRFRAFAFVHNPPQVKIKGKKCGGCKKRRLAATKTKATAAAKAATAAAKSKAKPKLILNYNLIKRSIANLPNADKLKFRKLLGTKQVKFTFRNAAGKVQTMLF